MRAISWFLLLVGHLSAVCPETAEGHAFNSVLEVGGETRRSPRSALFIAFCFDAANDLCRQLLSQRPPGCPGVDLFHPLANAAMLLGFGSGAIDAVSDIGFIHHAVDAFDGEKPASAGGQAQQDRCYVELVKRGEIWSSSLIHWVSHF